MTEYEMCGREEKYICSENLKEKDHLEDSSFNNRIIVQYDLGRTAYFPLM
jgi:hypothetical protein